MEVLKGDTRRLDKGSHEQGCLPEPQKYVYRIIAF